jgi:hypothetical protein
MSASVLHFIPRSELGPQANLDAFIDLCMRSEVLDARQQFETNVWKIGHLKGHNTIHRAVFSSLEASSRAAPEPAMSQPFLNFAKATLIYLHDKRPVIGQAPRLAAFRCLEAALREWNKGSRPTAVNEEVLDTAVELARKQVSAGVAYRIGGQLEVIAELMNSKEIISLRQRWVHGLKKPRDFGSRISKEAINARQQKLPSAATLRALANIFQDAVNPSDVLVSSYAALMLCAPERINEVLRIKRNCLVEGEGRFRGKLGLRWAGSKGADDTTKWLPTQMVPVARQAIEKLTILSRPAQEIAEWYTANPTTLYLHKAAAGLRGREVITLEEIALILWGDEAAFPSARGWAQTTNKLKKVALGGRKIGYRFEDVERTVLAMLPSTFPYVPGSSELLCKDAMAVMRTSETHSQKATFLCMFSCTSYNVIANAFGRSDLESIFDRFGYKEDDGSPIEFRSHQLRHYLNMLAQTTGLSDTMIAIFSGRKDVAQNRVYDHMSSDEVQMPISQALKAGFTADIVSVSTRDLIARSEFKKIGIVAAHTTEFGWCTHNFASEPCQMYRDCINCEEQECIKGERQKETNLRVLKSETEYLLNEAREALDEKEYGADTWVAHQTKTLERINALLSIVDDPEVSNGARVRLNLSNAALITVDNFQTVKIIRSDRQKKLK